MKTLLPTLLSLGLLATLAPTRTVAQNPPPVASPVPPPSLLAKYEESFVANLMQDCVVEGRIASAARNRANNPDVRELGAALGTDYPKLAEELSIFAAKKSVKLPADLEASHQKIIDTLSSVSVEEFDSAYLVLAINDQTRFLATIQPILTTTNDADLKALLLTTATRISDDLARAKAIQQKYAGASLDAKATVPK